MRRCIGDLSEKCYTLGTNGGEKWQEAYMDSTTIPIKEEKNVQGK